MPREALTAGHMADTTAARAAFLRRFEDEVDPERTLDPDERARLAEEARRGYFAELGRKSGQARREQSEAVAELLHRTRVQRGMALVITDPAVIERVAHIVAAEGGGASDAA